MNSQTTITTFEMVLRSVEKSISINEHLNFCRKSLLTCVWGEALMGVLIFMFFLIITKSCKAVYINPNLLLIILGIAEASAFVCVSLAIIFKSSVWIFGFIHILSSILMYKVLQSVQKKGIVRALICVLYRMAVGMLSTLRILVALNSQNENSNIDIAQKVGTALTIVLMTLYTVFDNNKWIIPYYNNGLVDYDVKFTEYEKKVVYKVIILFNGDKYIQNVALPYLHRKNSNHFLREVCDEMIRCKPLLRKVCRNIFKQKLIDKELLKLKRNDPHFNALLTAFSTCILKIAAKYNDCTIIEHLRGFHESFKRNVRFPVLDIVVLDMHNETTVHNMQLKNISIISKVSSSVAGQINDANELRKAIANVPENQMLLKLSEAVNEITVEITKTDRWTFQSYQRFINNYHIRRFITFFDINDYNLLSNDEKLMLIDSNMSCSLSPLIKGHGHTLNLRKLVTVTNFLNYANSMKQAREIHELTVVEDECEIEDGITAELAIAIYSNYVRVRLYDDASPVVIEKIDTYSSQFA